MVILDTNIIIDHLRSGGDKSSLLETVIKRYVDEVFCLSVISVQELYQGKGSKKENEDKRMETAMEVYQLMPYTYEVAKIAGQIVRDNKELISFPDAAIAATAMVNGAQLLTLNKKHFEGIKELKLFEL